MESIILYSFIGCSKCLVLKTLLSNKNINFKLVTDEDEMEKLNFTKVPMLRVNDKLMEYPEALAWVNNENIR